MTTGRSLTAVVCVVTTSKRFTKPVEDSEKAQRRFESFAQK
jgi:hypothetical protein